MQHQDTINKVQENEDHLLQLIKNQTSVINSTDNLLKEVDDHYDKEIQRCHKHLEIVNSKLEMNSLGNDLEIRIGMIESYNRIANFINK